MRPHLLFAALAGVGAMACSEKPHVVIFNETGTDILLHINSTPQSAGWTHGRIVVKQGSSRRMAATELLEDLDPVYSRLRLRVGRCEYSYRIPDGYRPGVTPDEPLLLQVEPDLLVYRASDPWRRLPRARLLQTQRDGYPVQASERVCSGGGQS